MANFHINLFVIAADEDNMCKVLARMAMNLAANKEYTGFDLANIDGLDTARALYYQVGPSIDACYIFAFAGAPIPEDVAAHHTPGWSSPTSSEGGFKLQLAAMMQATEKFNANAPEGVSIGLAETAPTARGLSDSASVSFAKHGENWVLTVMYDTAWSPNSEDLDTFFMGLPEGSYGVAFFDADEYDGYESISTFSGLHHGLAGMQDIDGDGEFDVFDAPDLKAQKRECASVNQSEVDDIAKLARIAALSGWSRFGWDDEDDGGYDDYDDGYYGSDGESVNQWDRPPVNWCNPTPGDVSKIVSAVVDIAAALPLIADIGYGYTKEGNNAVESLLPGDAVLVSGEWTETYFSALKVSTLDGAQIGYVGSWIRVVEDYDVNRIALGILSLMLPHTKATVCELTPVSLRNTGVEGPNMSIRLDMEEVDFGKLRDEVSVMLEKPCTERTLSSDAKGAM